MKSSARHLGQHGHCKLRTDSCRSLADSSGVLTYARKQFVVRKYLEAQFQRTQTSSKTKQKAESFLKRTPAELPKAPAEVQRWRPTREHLESSTVRSSPQAFFAPPRNQTFSRRPCLWRWRWSCSPQRMTLARVALGSPPRRCTTARVKHTHTQVNFCLCFVGSAKDCA